MNWPLIVSWLFLALAAGSAAYSLIVLFAVFRFLRLNRKAPAAPKFTPPVSLLKPLYGADRGLEESIRSFCLQDYPVYEILFSVREESDPAVPIVRRLQQQFPQVPMRLLLTGPPRYPSAKVHGLEVMMETAAHEILVISDSGVRTDTDYLRRVVAPLADPAVGLVTCVPRANPAPNVWSLLEALGMNTQYAGGVFSAWLLLGMEFALGATMATRKEQVRRIGGMGILGNFHGDDFVLGERIAQAKYEVVLSDYVPEKLLSDRNRRESFRHRLLWERSSRHSRPAGYVGQIFMHNLPLALLAWCFAPSGSLVASGVATGMVYGMIGACLLSRALVAWACAGPFLRDPSFRKYWWLLPLQDTVSFAVWLWAFFGREITWRGARFRVQKGGTLEPSAPRPSEPRQSEPRQ